MDILFTCCVLLLLLLATLIVGMWFFPFSRSIFGKWQRTMVVLVVASTVTCHGSGHWTCEIFIYCLPDAAADGKRFADDSRRSFLVLLQTNGKTKKNGKRDQQQRERRIEMEKRDEARRRREVEKNERTHTYSHDGQNGKSFTLCFGHRAVSRKRSRKHPLRCDMLNT